MQYDPGTVGKAVAAAEIIKHLKIHRVCGVGGIAVSFIVAVCAMFNFIVMAIAVILATAFYSYFVVRATMEINRLRSTYQIQ